MAESGRASDFLGRSGNGSYGRRGRAVRGRRLAFISVVPVACSEIRLRANEGNRCKRLMSNSRMLGTQFVDPF